MLQCGAYVYHLYSRKMTSILDIDCLLETIRDKLTCSLSLILVRDQKNLLRLTFLERSIVPKKKTVCNQEFVVLDEKSQVEKRT